MGAGLGAGNQDGGAGGGTGCSRAVPSAGLSTRPVGQAVPTGREEPSKASAPGFRNRSEGRNPLRPISMALHKTPLVPRR